MKQDNPRFKQRFKQIGTHQFKRIVEYDDDWYSDDPDAPEMMYGDDDQFDDDGRADDDREFGKASHDHEVTVRNLTNNLDKLSRILTDAQELATLIGKDSVDNPDAAAQAFQGQEVPALAAQLKGVYNAFRTGDADPSSDASDEYFK